MRLKQEIYRRILMKPSLLGLLCKLVTVVAYIFLNLLFRCLYFFIFRYCTVVVWVAFVVLYLGTLNKALTMSITFSISATIALILLFFPKLYIILFHPERNVRASYTTTKLIRCHFGNSQGTQDSKHASAKTRASSQSMSIR